MSALSEWINQWNSGAFVFWVFFRLVNDFFSTTNFGFGNPKNPTFPVRAGMKMWVLQDVGGFFL
jgi:hypothetical protein